MSEMSKNYNDIQDLTDKQNLEDISQYKLLDRICHLFYGVYNMQSTVCREKQNTIQHYIDQSQEKNKRSQSDISR